MNPSREDMFRAGVTSPVSSMSIVIGDAVRSRCNGRCPFCCARLSNATGLSASDFDQHLINWGKTHLKLDAACRFAKTTGVTNILLTGRGEPTLYPNEIDEYLVRLNSYGFPFIELQTNGITIDNAYKGEATHFGFKDLLKWQANGLTHIAVSMVHWDKDRNNEIYGAKTPVDLEDLFSNLDQDGFSVRACLMLMKDYVDSVEDFDKVVGLCNSWGAKQLRVASIARPEESSHPSVAKWVDEHVPEHSQEIVDHVIANGHYLRTLPHGAPVFDYNGLSVCLACCFPKTNAVGNGMQPIFWPDGSLTYSWEWKGAVLL